MLDWKLFGRAIGRRLFCTVLTALGVALLFLLERWILEDLLEWPNAFLVEMLTVVTGFCYCVFYLFGGRKWGIWGAGAMGGATAFIIAIDMLPTPWNLVLTVAVLAAFPAQRLWKQRRLKRELLLRDPDMTGAQAAEIVATAAAVNSSAMDELLQEGGALPEMDCLPVSDAVRKGRKRYLLFWNADGCKLCIWDNRQRIEDLVAGKPVDAAPGDIEIPRDSISGIALSTYKRGLCKVMHITVHTPQRDYVYIPGIGPAARVVAFFEGRGDIPVDNRVEPERALVVSIPDAAERIRRTDAETVARMRASRQLNALMAGLSFVSMSFVLLGVLYPVLFLAMLLVPVATTAVYIRRQDDLHLDGSSQGKSSISLAYIWNPAFTGFMLLAIVLDFHRPLAPICWVAGLLSAVLFAVWTLRSVRELRRGMWKRIGIVFFAAGFGAQIAVVASLLPSLLPL